MSISAKAKNEDDAGCPSDVCIGWLGYPQWDGIFAIAKPQVVRLCLSDVTYGDRTHPFVAAVYPDDPNDMKVFLPHVEDVLATVQVPATAA